MAFSDGDLDRFINVREAAARLGIGASTAYRMIQAGSFPVPVFEVAGKQRVSLRQLAEFMYGSSIEVAA